MIVFEKRMCALDFLKFKMWLLLIGPPKKKRIRKPSTHKATITKQRVEHGRQTKKKSISEKSSLRRLFANALITRTKSKQNWRWKAKGNIWYLLSKHVLDTKSVQQTQLNPKRHDLYPIMPSCNVFKSILVVSLMH